MLSISFLRAHCRLLGFGVLMTFCSSMGQTFFISLFSGEIRADFALSDGEFGSLYSLGTLTSAAVLLWAGRLIDRLPLPVFAAAVLALLGETCLLMGATWSAASLAVALFGLRFFGQGLSSHSAMVAMGRYFEAQRGRALSVATLGHTLGEAILPALVVAALALAGWRQLWSGSGLLLLVLAPLVLLLLKGQRDRDAAVRRQQESRATQGDRALAWVLRDPGLWLRLPALLAGPFIGTGLIFHQVHLAESKGWPLSLLAGSFTAYAACALGGLLLAGPLVDRFAARRLVPLLLVPLTLACLTLALSDAAPAATLFMGLLGLTTGSGSVIFGALWAELYGVTHLGAIRACATSAMVFSTGLAPATLGFFIDRGAGMESIALACALYCLIAGGLAISAEAAARRRVQAEGS
ncbi:MFS transporter [Pelagibius marinus]|uniref:MFS transporter n=1 Tax=Pelagibius marinus TaxID=2762760 RepID=UPI001872F8FC|nr:MFS transporter [Pelagibius marinus]